MDSAWECECGTVEYGSIPPAECEKCFKIDSFTQLPTELIEERIKDVDTDFSISKVKVRALKSSKSKTRRKK